MIVSVDGLEAACHTLDCGYTYEAATGEITAFTITGRDITITGTNLPTGDDVTIGISGLLCKKDSLTLSPTSASCSLEDDVVAGSWNIEMKDTLGLIPLNGPAKY